MALRFRDQLGLLVGGLVIVGQLLTAGAVAWVVQDILVRKGVQDLSDQAALLTEQFAAQGAMVADSVEILAADTTFRMILATRDYETALKILGERLKVVGNSRSMIIAHPGLIIADTAQASAAGVRFPFPDLLAMPAGETRSAAMVVLDSEVLWLITVRVTLPALSYPAFVSVGLPVDRALLNGMQALSALPKTIAIAVDAGSAWYSVAQSDGMEDLTEFLPAPSARMPRGVIRAPVDGLDSLLFAVPLITALESAQVVGILRYPLAEALASYRPLLIGIFGLLAIGMVITIATIAAIARSVSRPLEQLAGAADRVGAGNYTKPVVAGGPLEVRRFAKALGRMTQAIEQREVAILEQARRDATTGLPNRFAMVEALGTCGTACAIIVFKPLRLGDVVRTLGQSWGDRVIREIGERSRAVLPAHAVIARVSDGSIGVALPQTDARAATEIAEAIVGALQPPLETDGFSLDLTSAAGIVLRPDHGDDARLLLQRAAVALDQSVKREALVLYDGTRDPYTPLRLSLMSELRHSITAGHLALHYQPKLDLRLGRITAAEALVRWHHPSRGFIPPDSFIPLAEETGVIRQLTHWAIETAARQSRIWADQGVMMRVGVNVSVRDLMDDALHGHVIRTLSSVGLPPQGLALEVTESGIMQESEIAFGVLREIGNLGIEVAIDDFGVGQSSLAYLRHLPVHELKIDRSFVKNVADDEEDGAIVRTVVELARRLGYKVTAEGVEDGKSLAYLAEIGADHAQGYHVSRPLPVDAFTAFVADAHRASAA